MRMTSDEQIATLMAISCPKEMRPAINQSIVLLKGWDCLSEYVDIMLSKCNKSETNAFRQGEICAFNLIKDFISQIEAQIESEDDECEQ